MAERTEHTDGQRDVVVDDPELSPSANEVLSAEAQKALGAKRVPPRGQGTQPARVRGGTDGGLTATLAHNRLLVAMSLFVVLLVGVIVSLATDNWIFLGAAVFAHAVASAIWAFIFIQLASEPEHAEPGAAAMLEAEGVSDPDARLSEIVEDFEGGETQHKASEPATSIDESAPSFMIWLPAVGLLIVSAITPFVTDGRGLWLVPVILWPLVIGTLLYAWRRPEGAGSGISQHPRAFALALACGALGLVLVLIGLATSG